VLKINWRSEMARLLLYMVCLSESVSKDLVEDKLCTLWIIQ
jgi:hypothetical protein